jgi:hypothetical protein
VGTGGAAALLLAARRQRTAETALKQKDRDQLDVARTYALQERIATPTSRAAVVRTYPNDGERTRMKNETNGGHELADDTDPAELPACPGHCRKARSRVRSARSDPLCRHRNLWGGSTSW